MIYVNFSKTKFSLKPPQILENLLTWIFTIFFVNRNPNILNSSRNTTGFKHIFTITCNMTHRQERICKSFGGGGKSNIGVFVLVCYYFIFGNFFFFFADTIDKETLK